VALGTLVSLDPSLTSNHRAATLFLLGEAAVTSTDN
jgi:hypothetical protein